MKDFAEIALDCGLRPGESYDLKWNQIRNGSIEIHRGKNSGSPAKYPGVPAGHGNAHAAKGSRIRAMGFSGAHAYRTYRS